MRKSLAVLLGTAVVAAVVARPAAQPANIARPDMRPVPAHPAPSTPRLAPRASRTAPRTTDKAVIEQYCLECHDADKAKGASGSPTARRLTCEAARR